VSSPESKRHLFASSNYNPYGGYCKHIVALLLASLHHPKSFTARKAPAELLADMDQDDLVAILTKLMQEQPGLYDPIEALTSVPSKFIKDS
jgi:uncharacterized Zn finger protein